MDISFLAHLRFDPLARQCSTEHKPEVLPVQWATSVSTGTIFGSNCTVSEVPNRIFFQLAFELFVLLMTAIKVLEHRRSDQIITPLMKTLFYDQLMYYVVSDSTPITNSVVNCLRI